MGGLRRQRGRVEEGGGLIASFIRKYGDGGILRTHEKPVRGGDSCFYKSLDYFT